jgi:methionyl aminopeptidase
VSIESESDWVGLRAIGRIVGSVLSQMRNNVRPGVTTAEIDAIAARALTAHGARHAPRFEFGFPGDCCISVNDEAVHGIPGPRVLRPGDLVKLDVVAEKDGYCADAAITVGVPPVSVRHRRLIACARSAFAKAMRQARAGAPIGAIGGAIQAEVRHQGFSVLRDLAGHGTGRRIHEPPMVPNYDPGLTERLREGLVIAVEPIIATGSGRIVEDPDGWTIRTAEGGFAAHFEHTVVIMNDRAILFTAA